MATQVLILSPYGGKLLEAFNAGESVELRTEGEITPDDLGIYDWVICYGYRKIIREPFLSAYRGRLLNLHISYLPYNRGADPNFWAWFDDTPHGVSLHEVDHGTDTGRLIAQAKVTFDITQHTLATSYAQLHQSAVLLFESVWPGIRGGAIHSWPQDGHGTYHRKSDKDFYMKSLPMGWDTHVSVIQSLGRYDRDNKE